MRTTDLMVGDWVEVIQNSEKHFAQVQMIDGYGDNATSNECICDAIYYSIDELNPIPLTTEILEGSGFDVMVYDNGDKLFAYGSLCVLDHKGLLTFKISDCRKRINYVHELQHALKLCGIEKDIQL